MPESLRVGVLGTARIARGFVDGVRPSSRIDVVAVASRDADQARDFAAALRIPRAHTGYEALLADPDIEAVYIPLPNGLHAHWAMEAARAGKHVLCEKPLAGTAADVRAMFDAAAQQGVHLVEAFPFRAQPHLHALLHLIAQGAIGRVRHVHASFGFLLQNAADIRRRADLAGGALMDVGSYPVNLLRAIAGAPPIRVSAIARFADSGVDESLSGTLEHADGLVAQISCAFDTSLHRQALIVGDHGVIDTTYPNHSPDAEPLPLTWREGVGRDARVRTESVAGLNGFLAEAESFAALVRGEAQAWNGTTARESIDNAHTLDALLRSAREGRPVPVG